MYVIVRKTAETVAMEFFRHTIPMQEHSSLYMGNMKHVTLFCVLA